MKFCYFITHPAKFHFLKPSYDELVSLGHEVDWVIITKDILEELVASSGDNYVNIYKSGRKSSIFPKKAFAAFTFLITLLKLIRLQIRKRYDVIVTDDAGVVQSWLFTKPSIFILDNDISTLSYASFLLDYASVIFSPESTEVGKHADKKVGFGGVKALMHLHPNRFKPSVEFQKELPEYFAFIRVSHLNAAHDTSNHGITDIELEHLIRILESRFKNVLISAQREVADQFKKYLIAPPVDKMSTILSGASVVVTDSGTMASEAAILGVPNYLLNNLSFKIGVHKELMSFGIQKCFTDYDSLETELNKDLSYWNLERFSNAAKSYVEEKGDPSGVLVDLLVKQFKS